MSLLLQAVALVAGAIGAGVIAAWFTRTLNPEGWRGPAVFAVVVLLVALALIQGGRTGEEDSPAATDPRSPDASSVPTTWSTTETPSMPTTAPPAMATSLLDLPAAAEETNDSIDLDDAESTEVDGTTYGRLLVYSCSVYCDGGSPQVREVTIGRKYEIFEVTFAVLDSARGRHHLDVTLDGARPRTFRAEPGKPAAVNLDVQDVSRMRLQLFSPGPLKDPVQSGANAAAGASGGGLPGAALGDPILMV